MDPSAAPWRVLDASEPPAALAGDAHQKAQTSSLTAGLSISPLTVAGTVGVVVLAVAAFAFAASSAGGGTVQVSGGSSFAPLDGAAGAGGTALAGVGTDVIVVEIVGAVRQPGVFKLPVGSRIGDLVDAAGGYGPRLDAARATLDLNLAAKLADGDRVVVPSRDDMASSTSGTAPGGGSGSGSGGTGVGTAAPVDLNRATAAELEALPGIGPVTASKIITSREEQPFAAVEDLRTRKLVGAKTFDGLKDLVAVR